MCYNMSNNYIRQSARGYEPLRANDLLYSEQRTLFFTDQVNTDTIKGVVQELMFLDSESSEPITLYVGSPGGDVTAGLMLYDTIRSMRSKVVTIASGIAASMGAIILLAGDERKILPNSKVMIHDPAYFGNISGKKPHQLRSQLEDLIEVQKTLCSIIAERTGHTVGEIEEITREDSYYSAQEALDFGLVQEILAYAEKDSAE
ncbi:MAG: ATP-dependent Clp protease proteolytic subunit [Ruminococcus sp.]|nr:ATP-dependent Clp protease proteolytic subunit [Ruminococcus sp.]